MRKLFIITLFCLLGTAAFAQTSPVNIGIHGGWNNTRINIKQLKVDSHDGFMVGVFARVNLGNLYIASAVNYAGKTSVNKTNDLKLKYHSIDVPILLGTYIFKTPVFKLRGFVGPVASFLTRKLDKNFFRDTDKTMWNGRLGAGIDLWKLTFDVDYEFGLKRFGDGAKAPCSWNLTLGFKFL